MNITGRLSALVHSNLYRSRRAFATAAGINEVTLSDNLRKGTEPRFSTLEAILKANPKISAEWLMRGEGNMFRAAEQTATNVTHLDKPTISEGENGATENSSLMSVYASLVEQLRKENATLNEQIRNKDTQIAQLLAILSK